MKSKVDRMSKMVTRVCKPAKGAETMEMGNAVSMAICIGWHLNQIQTRGAAENPRRMVVCSDSKSLIESLSSTKQASKGPMRLNTEQLKGHRDHRDVMEYKWVPTRDMLADALTKQWVDPAVLVSL